LKGTSGKRLGWDRYFMKIAEVVAERSTCLRRHVGAVLVKDKQILATGYNGAPRGITHCEVTGCLRERLKVPSGQRHELCRGLHAEQNAIIQAAVHGVSIKGCDAYITVTPCVVCAKMLINAAVQHIIVADFYADKLALLMLKEAGVKLYLLNENDERVDVLSGLDAKELEKEALGELE